MGRKKRKRKKRKKREKREELEGGEVEKKIDRNFLSVANKFPYPVLEFLFFFHTSAFVCIVNEDK
jgi:hypothetical protein